MIILWDYVEIMGLYRYFTGVGKQWEGCKDLILTYSSVHVIKAVDLSTNLTVTLALIQTGIRGLILADDIVWYA